MELAQPYVRAVVQHLSELYYQYSRIRTSFRVLLRFFDKTKGKPKRNMKLLMFRCTL